MGKLINFITNIHNKTKRNYIERMVNEKVKCMLKAKEYEYEYWDGDRKFGYGGYKYDERWKPIAEKMISYYEINNNSSILDIGCGKAFLLYEIKKILPNVKITGIDISNHGLKNSPSEIKDSLFKYNAKDNLPFGDKDF